MPLFTDTSYLICAGVTLISATVSLGFSVAAVRPAPARPLALYAMARSAALFVASLAVFFVRTAGWLEAIAASMIMVQAADALVGVTIKDRMKTIGPGMTAVFNAAALWWFLA